MPTTHWTFLVGCLAIAGIPGLAGFFSKDEILWYAWSGPHGHPIFWAVGTLVAGLTAFYMFRALIMTFHGECKGGAEADPAAESHGEVHLAESPAGRCRAQMNRRNRNQRPISPKLSDYVLSEFGVTLVGLLFIFIGCIFQSGLINAKFHSKCYAKK